MRIRKPGRVNERIWFLGREKSGVYLLEGNDSFMIVSGGMSYIVSDLLQQFKEFGINEDRIALGNVWVVKLPAYKAGFAGQRKKEGLNEGV